MEIKLTLALPRDELSVPVARRVLQQSMGTLGVDAPTTDDIVLALTEACTNVLDHAVEADEYEVSAGIDGEMCVIEVIDRGRGFDGNTHGHDLADDSAEEGRGIMLMRALLDKVEFTSHEHTGTVVHLEKRLVWTENSPIRLLTEGKQPIEHGPWSDDEHFADKPGPVVKPH